MKLTDFADYSLRVLIYAALRPDELVTVQEIASTFDIQRNHLVKVVNALSRSGYLTTVRGRAGGLPLRRVPVAGHQGRRGFRAHAAVPGHLCRAGGCAGEEAIHPLSEGYVGR